MSFSIIACVGRNLELGISGGLIWRIPEDMKFFRDTTMGHKVVMGRKTFESLPPAGLPGREMVVLTSASIELHIVDTRPSGPSSRADGATASLRSHVPRGERQQPPHCPQYVDSIDALLEKYRDSDEEVFVIGGASVYEQFLPYVSTMYLTEVDAEESGADVYFPEFDASLFSREEIGGGEFEGLKYKFVKYKRKEFVK